MGIYEKLCYCQSPTSSLLPRRGPGNRAHKAHRGSQAPLPSLAFFHLDDIAPVRHFYSLPGSNILRLSLSSSNPGSDKIGDTILRVHSWPSPPFCSRETNKASESLFDRLGLSPARIGLDTELREAPRSEPIISKWNAARKTRIAQSAQIWHSGLVYRFSRNGKCVQPFWGELRDTDFYCKWA